MNNYSRSELILEDKRGMRKLIRPQQVFISMEEARRWVDKKYKGHRLIGVQDGLFNNVRV